ncbi:MAG: cytochrome c [Chitinophagaceae bacterium]|nr:cytochrome c [Bauldia sp.]MCW5929960.1 cytochrome c [Chitinophagaceae bacterium]
MRQVLFSAAALALLAGCASVTPTATGLSLVTANCAGCHAVGPAGPSPHPEAPPFRELKERYPVAFLAEALAEGIATGHPAMPEFVLQPDEINAVIAYLETL